MESMKKRAGALAVFVLALMACLGVFTGTAYADSTVNITYRRYDASLPRCGFWRG